MNRPTFMTKIRLPRRRTDLLRRRRLVDFLHENIDKRLIIVCAGAGYGKTTLLVDFAHDVDLPVCWYSMDAADVDPRTFFEYLILSLRQPFPDFGKQTEALLGSVEDASKEIVPIIASLTNEIQSDIPDYFMLILDDFHWVDDSESINSALDMFIYYLPDNCHLILSSRTLPRLTFSRLAAQRQAVGLGTGELRFTAEEVTRLLQDNYQVALAGRNVEKLLDASEGWITGIILTTHSLWRGPVGNLAQAKKSGSPLFDYLAEEAYDQQPRKVQRFLLCSSVLNQMTPDLCDRLFAGGTAAESLNHLVRANLFISELEGPGDWYRYHNLFQEFLQTKLKGEDPNLFTRLHCLAAEMAENEGDWETALGHHRAADDLEGAAGLVERAAKGIMRSGRWRTLYRWLDALPVPIIEAHPVLSLYRGHTYLLATELDKSIAQLDQALRGFQLVGNLEDAARALTLKSITLRLKGRLGDAMETATRVLGLGMGTNSLATAEARQEIGICLASLGRLQEAETELSLALQIYECIGDDPGIATVCRSMGILTVRMGDLARGMALYRRALDLWRSIGNATRAAGVLSCIASLYYYTGEYPEALSAAEEALANARQGGYMRGEAFALATLGDIKRDSGSLEAALEQYESALDIAQRVDEVQLANYLRDALANTHRLLGNYAMAERLVRQAIQQAEEGQSPYEIATYSTSAGVLAEEQGDVARAEQLLRMAVDQLRGFGSLRELARARFHLARTLLARGEQEEAAAELDDCLELCRQLGYDQFMVAEGHRAGELLAWARARGIGGRRLELVEKRLQQTGHSAPPASRPKLRVAPSGPRQIRILSLGKAQVQLDSRPLTSSDWVVERTKELFFYLLEQPYSPRKEQIVDALWPELDLGKSNSQFHSTVYRLRRAISPQCLEYHDGRYGLLLGKEYWYDAEEFTRLLDEADLTSIGRERRIDGYERALDLYQGPFLEEFYGDWVTPKRDEMERRRIVSISRLARLKAESGELEQAVDLLRSAMAGDPFREETHYGLILYSSLMGDRAGALRFYKRYVKLLSEELGAGPSAKVSDLANRIAHGQSAPAL